MASPTPPGRMTSETSVRRIRDPDFNPFVNTTEALTGRQIRRYIFPGLLLIPLRVVFSLGVIVFLSLAAIPFWLGFSNKDLSRPRSGWRLLFTHRIIPIFARLLLFCIGVFRIHIRRAPCEPLSSVHAERRRRGLADIRCRDTLSSRDEAPIVVANHVSLLDPIVLLTLGPMAFVAKAGVANIPFVGRLATVAQTIFVGRQSAESRAATRETILERAKPRENADGAEYPRVAVFPEGTCSNGRAVISFKHGAFAPMLPVQPIVLRYPSDRLDVSFTTSSVRLVLRLLSCFATRVEVVVLDPMAPTPEEVEAGDVGAFAQRVREAMAVALGAGVTDHAYDDMLLQIEAVSLLREADPAAVRRSTNVQVGSLRGITRLDGQQLRQLLQKFVAYDAKGDGYLDYQEFRQALGWDDTRAARRVFILLDDDEDGRLAFREFVVGLALMSRVYADPEVVAAAFDLADRDKTGQIGISQLWRLMRAGFPSYTFVHARKLFDACGGGKRYISREDFTQFLSANPHYLVRRRGCDRAGCRWWFMLVARHVNHLMWRQPHCMCVHSVMFCPVLRDSSACTTAECYASDSRRRGRAG
eukprot:TRINITY_DN1149_c0_g1_i2.p1 TRINITY_DN1149_c0_g1~~TRINITY_DN1149_c0_g1_i2.p1  ORF type:complete len:586 (+),score=74.38 TRINITY_DN1149_c0_g1_i2:138-1895(+)